MSKHNSTAWALGIASTLLVSIAAASFALLLNMSRDVASIAVAVKDIGARVDRMDVRHTKAYNGLNFRLRDMEMGE